MKTLGFAVALSLAGAAAQAGTLFEIPINGGIARLQLDEDCQKSVCASISWTENDRHRNRHKEMVKKAPAKPATAAGAPGAAGAPAGPAPEQTVVARLASPRPVPPASEESAASAVGEWLVEGGEARIRIGECAKNLCGVVSAANNANETDRKNPNPELRNRPIIGLPVLLDLKPAADNRWEGQIYNAKNGQTYEASLSLIDSQRLRVEGCVFGGFICGGQNWTRVN